MKALHVRSIATATLLAGSSSPIIAWTGVTPSSTRPSPILRDRLPLQSVSSPVVGTGADVSGEKSHWLDYLKFDGQTPTFDVIEKTKEYTSLAGYRTFSLRDIPHDYYSDEYIFRGPIVGPINRQDLVYVNGWFGLEEPFPDLDRQVFGFTADPENPFRVLFFERWKATNTGKFKGVVPPTYRTCETPVMPFSIVWTPDGQIIYEHLTTAVDRFEGNTRGKVAVFGLLETAGLGRFIGSQIGDPTLVFLQKMGRTLPSKAQMYSRKEDLPRWWKSEAVGAEPNDL